MEKTTTAAVAAQDINNTLAPQKVTRCFFGIALASLSLRIFGEEWACPFNISSKIPLSSPWNWLDCGFWLPDSLLVAINFVVARKVLMAPFLPELHYLGLR